MTYQEFKKAAFEAALSLGAKAAEAVYTERDKFSVGILSGDIDSYTVANAYGFGLRVELDGKNGYAYTENLSDPADLAARAIDNARAIESEDLSPMQGAQEYVSVPEKTNPLCEMQVEERIEHAKKLEAAALAADSRIARTQSTMLTCTAYTVSLSNTLGLDATRSGRSSMMYTVPIAQDQASGEVRPGAALRMGEAALDVDGCAREAAELAVSMLGAAPAPSGNYHILLKNDAACDMMNAFASMFSAESAQKNMSPLTGREGQTIGAACITLTDDPLDERNPSAFDDEGTPSVATTLVENGVFRGFLHNLKTARKAGCASTSNAHRASAASPVGIAPTNLILAPGTDSYEDLLGKLGDGLVIQEVSGLHSGLNPISGDFSLLSSGYLVENGKIVRPVDRITIAGNILQLLKDVEAVGADVYVSPTAGGVIALPSLLLRELVVAGE